MTNIAEAFKEPFISLVDQKVSFDPRLVGSAQALDMLGRELTAMQRLQEISTQLLVETEIETLYTKIAEAAAIIMDSGFTSMQMKQERNGEAGLKLLAGKGFDERAGAHWKWVDTYNSTSCAAALARSERVIIPDVEASPLVAGADLDMFRELGIRSSQSTPLVSRNGKLLGMISTHWRQPHQPATQDLRLLDVLARQAADLIERALAGEHTQLLLREVSHRAKNILAVVQSMARQTAAGADPETFAEQFSGRLASLAASQELLIKGSERGVELDELVRIQIAHLRDLIGTRIALNGPVIRLAAGAAQTIGMALHELCTNAVKYGALSGDRGLVTVAWSVTDEAEGACFVMNWHERDGPQVQQPECRGFGHSVVVRMVEHALDAEVVLDYQPEGLFWQLKAPLTAVTEAGPRPAFAQ
jgi:two-component sensor histidine kinase